MSEHETGQVVASAAAIYEEFFVPALFADWPEHVLDAAEIQAGHRVLDVACGTGILAREAQKLVGPNGSTVGVDVNQEMLAIARSKSSSISWETGAAESLPFESASFDRVVSQFGLMFFQDAAKAISEMQRVTRPGGKIGVAVWASLEDIPGYAMVMQMLNDLFGPEIARSVEPPFSLGDVRDLKALFTGGGVDNITVRTIPGKARFKSVESWIYTDIKGWTLADVINDEDYERLKREAPKRLSRFVLADGSVEFDAPAHIVTATA